MMKSEKSFRVEFISHTMFLLRASVRYLQNRLLGIYTYFTFALILYPMISSCIFIRCLYPSILHWIAFSAFCSYSEVRFIRHPKGDRKNEEYVCRMTNKTNFGLFVNSSIFVPLSGLFVNFGSFVAVLLMLRTSTDFFL